jgi:deoxycytidine triphosphate deaminase
VVKYHSTMYNISHVFFTLTAKRVIAILLMSFLTVSQVAAQSYENDIKSWYQSREKSLTAENGWLNLVGLLWL